MQGTGTQPDPYIPENWDEFVTAIGTSGAYVELPEGGGVFDMNDIAPEGGFTVDLKCSGIQGNDWEIRNAYNIQFLSEYVNKNIDNLHFLDFSDNAYNGMFAFGGETTVTGCKFSGISSGNTTHVVRNGILKRCSLNMKFIDNTLSISDNSRFYFSRIILDHSDSLSTSSFYTNSRYYNCFIEHKANANGTQLNFNGDTIVVHSDAGNYIRSSTGTKVYVTEEQLKDAEYLASVGFPIVP